jgi:exopolysaccharide/PEP-CTERM locus tyrosine autokinase
MSIIENTLKKLHEEPRTAHSAQQNAFAAPGVSAPGAFSGLPAEYASGRTLRIDLNALRAAGLLPPQHQERLVAEQYRQIKRPLIASATGRGGQRLPNGHLIMVASALSGEGKTFTSLNLALSMAFEKDLRVVLVDADVEKAHLSRLFGLHSQRGLLDVLEDPTCDLESAIVRTDIPGLAVVPAGRRSEQATELLASSRMQELMQLTGGRDTSRIVLFDSAPLLLTTQAHALAQVVGQIVLVVLAGKTSQDSVANALEALGVGKSVSLVLNQSVAKVQEGYYASSGKARDDAARP